MEEYRQGDKLGRQQKGNWPYPSALWVKQAEHLVELDDKLPDIAAGKTQPANLTERLELAEVAFFRKWYATSYGLYETALMLRPGSSRVA